METPSRLRRAAQRLVLASATLLLLAPSALAAGSGDRMVRTGEATSAAGISVLGGHDLGSGAWKGGTVAAPTSALCEAAGTKRVVNGVAASEFHGPGAKVQDSVAVLATPAMVQRDFAVSYGANQAALLRCFRAVAARQLEPNEKILSVAVRPAPGIGQISRSLRAVIAVTAHSGARSQVAFDAFVIGSGRSEATLLVTSPMSSFVDVWEQQLAETFAGKLAI
jgi:hypothetical protein